MLYHTPEKLNELIDFNDESINKKILMQNENSFAMLAALKKNQKMPQHTSNTDAFIYILEGEIDFFIFDEKGDNKEFNLDKNEVLFFKKDELHSLTAKKDSKFLVVRI